MIELLGRLFVRDRNNTHDGAVRRSWGTLVSTVGIILNILLFVGKFTVGSIFGAISITADAINNLSDAGSQLISLVSFRMSAKPADREHPFGHARIEYIASMAVSFIVLIIGFDLLRSAGQMIFNPEPTTFSWISVGVLIASIAVKLWIALFNRKVGTKIDSSVMRATAVDSLSDVLSTSAVLISQIILLVSGFDPDAYLGVAVALLIMWSGIKILHETMNSLLGEAPDKSLVTNINAVVTRHDGALGVHDLIVHNYGPGRTIVSLHVEVDGDVNIFTSHDLIDNIESDLREELGVEATIHLDPIVTNDEEVNSVRRVTEEKIHEIDPHLRIHDFRFVRGISHTNLIFDIAAPFELKLSDVELRRLAGVKMHEVDVKYAVVVNIDRE